MATTYTHTDFNNIGPNADLGSAVFHREIASTTLGAADEDIYKLGTAKRGQRIVDALVQHTAGDGHATPTGTVDLEVTDGTTTKQIIDAMALGTAGLKRPSKVNATENGIGFVIPSDNYWFQLRADTIAATPAAHAYEILIHLSPHREPGELTE